MHYWLFLVAEVVVWVGVGWGSGELAAMVSQLLRWGPWVAAKWMRFVAGGVALRGFRRWVFG